MNTHERKALEDLLQKAGGPAHIGLKVLLNAYDQGLIVTPLEKAQLHHANSTPEIRRQLPQRLDADRT